MEELFDIRSHIEMLTKDIIIYSIYSTVNKELRGIHTGGSSSFMR